jgi:hypothetical protein
MEKLIHVEIENSKLRNTHRKLRSQLTSYEEENHKLENIIERFKEQHEYCEKLKEEIVSMNIQLQEAIKIE